MKKHLLFLISLFLILEAKGPYCKNMKSCKEACKYYNQGYLKLDRDRDGIPCENICFAPCKKEKLKKTKKGSSKK